MLGTARVEPLIRRIRNSMMAAEMQVENSKGECNFGQHEINFHYADALTTADDHVIYKNGAKEIASQEGMSITFMAKFNEAEGNSCHIHCSVADESGENVFAAEPQTFDRFLAGQLACLRGADPVLRPARQLLQALRAGLVRAHRGRLGPRQPHLLDARGRPWQLEAAREPAPGRRRQPLPGARGDDRRRPARRRLRAPARELPLEGNAYTADKPHVPRNLYDARDLFAESDVAREAFGQEVVDHYLNRGEHRARRARGDGDRLGAPAGLRAALMSRRPVVGICAAIESARWTVWDGVETNISQRTYSTAVGADGGLPLILPVDDASAEEPSQLLGLLDGLILSGGSDIDPATYGAEPAPGTIGYRADRDRFELALARGALERDLPVLGVCRGAQMLNIARGGNLRQQVADAEVHLHTPGRFTDHEIRLEPGSLAASAAGARPDRRPLAPSPRARRARLRDRRHRLGRPRRPHRGGRGAREPLGAGDPLACGGGNPEPGDRVAGPGGRLAGGRAQGAERGMIAVVEPATEQVLAEVPRGGAEETDAAVAAAKAAFGAWRDVTPADRAADAAAARGRARGTGRGAVDARGAQRRQADRRRPRGDRDGGRVLPLLRRGARSGCSAARSRSPAGST